jgi:nucleoside-diphosphate-sugar epimerase
MTVLITGGSGFIGKNITTYFLENNWDVINISRTRANIPKLKNQFQLNIGEKNVIEKIINKISPCEHIIHCAANTDHDFNNPEVTSVNCFGTHQILNLAKKWEVESFVYLSGVNIIGIPIFHPITEMHPPNPQTVYHASKLFGENLSQIANKQFDLNTSILRISAPIGPGMPSNKIVPRFVVQALNNKPLQIIGQGTRKQNYVDVRDISRLVEQCIKKSSDGIYNIGGRECISNLDLAKLCIDCLNSKSEIVYTNKIDSEEGLIWDLSIEKAETEIGYFPIYTLERSIRDISKDYDNCNH